MLARRLCVYNAGLKVDVSREILTVVMLARSCQKHTVLCRVLLCSILASGLTTMSLDVSEFISY